MEAVRSDMWSVQYFNYMQLPTRPDLQVGTYRILKKNMTNKIVLGSSLSVNNKSQGYKV